MQPRRPSTYDIARLAGVSRSTVSFVLNKRMDIVISEETRARVLEVAKSLNYRPNQIARALITGTSHMIGIWMWSMSTPFNVSIIEHTLPLLRKDGYQPLFFDMQGSDVPTNAPDPSQWPLDGIIAEGNPAFFDRFIEQHEQMAPIVTVGVRTSALTDRVSFNIEMGVREALDHFVATGRRRIAFLHPVPTSDQSAEERYATYTRYMREAGRAPEYIPVEFSERSRVMVIEAIHRYIDAHGSPDAIFCFNDLMAVAANRALLLKGLRVPNDVSLIGCDGWIETEYQQPQLSTIELPLDEGCASAWTFLKNRMADTTLPQQSVIIAPRLRVRESSQPA